MKFKPMTVITIALIGIAVLTSSPQASAQTSSEANAAYNGYLSAFLVRSGSSAYFSHSINDHKRDYMWRQAEDITAIEDHWYRTHSSTTQALVTDLLNTFMATNNGHGLALGDFSWDRYDDDLGWATIAYVRGYAITGNPAFLKVAATNFKTVWSLGWDAAGGGGIWEQVSPSPENQRSVLATGTFIITGAALYQATGDSTYLSEAETAYAWARANVFNATNSTNSIGAPGHVTEGLTNTGALQHSDHTYNEGLMLESAAALYTLTNKLEYYNDAKLIISYEMKDHPIMVEQSDMFMRGVSNFAWQNNLWNDYISFMDSNANAAWNERRTDYNITDDNFTKATLETDDVSAMGAISSLTIQEVTPLDWEPPSVSLSGNFEIKNALTGMALKVAAASKTKGAEIIQDAFTSGQNAAVWKFIPIGSAYYRIQNVHSRLDMNVDKASPLIGAPLIQSPAQESAPYTDQWLPMKNPDGTYSFYNRATTLALEIPNSSEKSKTQLDQWYSTGTTNQEFKLIHK